MEPTEATLQPANSAKRIQPLDLLKSVHLLTPFVAMTESIAVRRVTAVVQAATVTNKEPVSNLVIEL